MCLGQKGKNAKRMDIHGYFVGRTEIERLNNSRLDRDMPRIRALVVSSRVTMVTSWGLSRDDHIEGAALRYCA